MSPPVFVRRLELPAKTRRVWRGELAAGPSGPSLTVTAGTLKKPSAKIETLDSGYEALEALHERMRAKLHDGYVLVPDAADPAPLVAALGVQRSPYHGLVAAPLPSGTALVTAVIADERVRALEVIGFADRAVRAEVEVPAALGELVEFAAWRDDRVLARSSRDELVVVSLDTGTMTVVGEAKASDRTRSIVVGGGSAVTARAGGQTLWRLDDTATQVRALDGALAALSHDGALLALAQPGWDHVRVLSTVDGRERARLSLGDGGAPAGLAIDEGLVVATGVRFAGAGRSATLAWRVADGARALEAVFGEHDDASEREVVIAGGLVVTIHVYGRTTVRRVSDGATVARLIAPGRSAVPFAAGGRLIVGDSWGVALAWELAALATRGRDELADLAALEAAPPPAPAATVSTTDGFGESSRLGQLVNDGLIITSYVAERCTYVPYASWPMTTARRAQVVIAAARSSGGEWLICDRDGLFRSASFDAQGEPLAPPDGDVTQVGWLGAHPVVFGAAGTKPRWHDGHEWRPITGLATPDAQDGGSTFVDGSGASLLTFRGAAYAVREGRAERVLTLLPGFLGDDTVVMSDGRVAFLTAMAVHLAGPSPTAPPTRVVHKEIFARLAPGPVGSALATASTFDAKGTALAGVWITATGDTRNVPKALFGATKADAVELLCVLGDQLACFVSGEPTPRTVPVTALAGTKK